MDTAIIKEEIPSAAVLPVMAVTDREGIDINGYVVGEGACLRYTVTFKNTAEQTKLFMVKVFLSEGVECLRAGNGGAYDKNSHTVTYAVDVAGQAEHTVTCDTKVKEMDTYAKLAGTAAVVTDTGCDETDPVANTVIVEPAANVRGADGDGIHTNIVYWNQAVIYEIIYTNFTDRPRNITIVDTLDGCLEHVGDIKDGGISDHGILKNGRIIWKLKDVPAHYTGKVSFTARTPRPAGSVDVHNKAMVTLHGDDIRFLMPDGEKGAGDMGFRTNEVWFHVPEWPDQGMRYSKKETGTDTQAGSGHVSVFTKKGSPLAGDTVRAVEFCFAALFMLAAILMTRKRAGRRKRQQAV